MGRILLLAMALVALVVLAGCGTTNMTKIHEHFDNYGQRHIEDEIQKGDQTIHYFFINKGLGWGRWGWYCWEYVSDKDGTILKKREYYVSSPTNNSENEQALDAFRKRIRQ
jgi:ABC-type uncharacterized transport system auxiliary subunit